MIIGIGTDIIEISRIEKVMWRKNVFMNKSFTENERKYFNSRKNRPEVIAGNFSAKEAVAKALSLGFRSFGLKDVEILRDPLGKPYVILHGNAKDVAPKKCVIHISISHSHQYAIAQAIIEEFEDNKCHNENSFKVEEVSK